LGGRTGSVVPKKQAAGYGVPNIAYDVGIAGKPGKASPVRKFELGLSTVDDAFLKRDGKADPGTQHLRVVGVVVHVAAEHIRIQPQFPEERFRRPHFVIVPVRGLNRQEYRGNARIESLRSRRAGQKNVFERRSLEDTVIRGVKIQADG